MKTAADLKVYTKYLWFETKRENEYVRITADVEDFVSEAGIKEGFVLVSAMHITAGANFLR